MFGHGLRRQDAGQVRSVGPAADARDGLGPQRCRIGIEPEDDTTAALLHKRREPVCKMLLRQTPGSQGASRMGLSPSGFTRLT